MDIWFSDSFFGLFLAEKIVTTGEVVQKRWSAFDSFGKPYFCTQTGRFREVWRLFFSGKILAAQAGFLRVMMLEFRTLLTQKRLHGSTCGFQCVIQWKISFQMRPFPYFYVLSVDFSIFWILRSRRFQFVLIMWHHPRKRNQLVFFPHFPNFLRIMRLFSHSGIIIKCKSLDVCTELKTVFWRFWFIERNGPVWFLFSFRFWFNSLVLIIKLTQE